MKTRDHDRIVLQMETAHQRQLAKARRVSAKHLCSYLTPATFAAVCADVERAADGAANEMLALLADLAARRADGEVTP